MIRPEDSTEPTVLIIEDHAAQRDALANALARRGFRALRPASIEDVRQAIQEEGVRIDVVYVDMDLRDWNPPQRLNGADLALELKDFAKDYPPEFIIRSAYTEVDYYRLAVKLGAAAYLAKQETDLADVVRHIRALAIRRRMRVTGAKARTLVEDIAVGTYTRAEVLAQFCRRFLVPRLERCLGLDVVILGRFENGRAERIAATVDFPRCHETFSDMIACTVGHARPNTPFLIAKAPDDHTVDGPLSVPPDLAGSAFVPLLQGERFTLVLGLLDGDESSRPLVEKPHPMARILVGYLEQAAVWQILHIATEIETDRRSQLCTVHRFSQWYGNAQLGLLDAARDAGEIANEGPSTRRLREMAIDLRYTGSLLESLLAARDESQVEDLSARELVRTAWADVEGDDDERMDALVIEEDCRLRGVRSALDIAVQRLFEWFAQRQPRRDDGPVARVCCREKGETSTLVFEDFSPRLHPRLRRQLFEPFSSAAASGAFESERSDAHLSLYVARMLIELGNRGTIEDRTPDAEDGSVGHRFVLRLPRASTA